MNGVLGGSDPPLLWLRRLRCGLGSRRISLWTVTSRPCSRIRTYSIRVARRWQARHGRGSPGGRLAHLRSDGVPGTGAASSPPPPAAASAPSRPRGACGDLVARGGGVGPPRCRFGRPLRVSSRRVSDARRSASSGSRPPAIVRSAYGPCGMAAARLCTRPLRQLRGGWPAARPGRCQMTTGPTPRYSIQGPGRRAQSAG